MEGITIFLFSYATSRIEKGGKSLLLGSWITIQPCLEKRLFRIFLLFSSCITTQLWLEFSSATQVQGFPIRIFILIYKKNACFL